MKKIFLIIALLLMTMPVMVSGVILEEEEFYFTIYTAGRHCDFSYYIYDNTDIGGFLDVYYDGSCDLYIVTEAQYFAYYNTTDIPHPLIGQFEFSVSGVYNQGPVFWNYTILGADNWYFVFYKAGGNSRMDVNATIWDWGYIPETTTTTYPTETTINPTTTTTTTTNVITTTTNTTSFEPFEFDIYAFGMTLILGFIGVLILLFIKEEKR